MSCTMHIQTKHVIEYADSGSFNYNQDSFHDLLDQLGVSYTTTNDEVPEYDRSFEIVRSELEEAVVKLEALERGKAVKDIDRDDFDYHLARARKTIPQLIKLYKWMISDSDPNHDMIYLDWF